MTKFDRALLRQPLTTRDNNCDRSNNIVFTCKNDTDVLSKLVEKYSSIPYRIVLDRLSHFWDIEEAFTFPVLKPGQNYGKKRKKAYNYPRRLFEDK